MQPMIKPAVLSKWEKILARHGLSTFDDGQGVLKAADDTCPKFVQMRNPDTAVISTDTPEVMAISQELRVAQKTLVGKVLDSAKMTKAEREALYYRFLGIDNPSLLKDVSKRVILMEPKERDRLCSSALEKIRKSRALTATTEAASLR